MFRAPCEHAEQLIAPCRITEEDYGKASIPIDDPEAMPRGSTSAFGGKFAELASDCFATGSCDSEAHDFRLAAGCRHDFSCHLREPVVDKAD
jgi:hypothetical protein